MAACILRERYIILDSLLFKLVTVPEKETALLAIPEICVDKIITLYHSSLFVGHQGVIKTYLMIADKFFIPNLMHYSHSYLKGCHICQLFRKDKIPTRQLQYGIPEYVIMDQDSAFMSTLMNYLFKKFNIKIKAYNHQSLQAEQGIKSLSTILTKYLTEQGQMWRKVFPVETLAYNTFHSPNLGNYRPYELVFSRKPKVLLDLETYPDIKVSGMFKDYYTLLNKRLKYLQNILHQFKSKHLVMINKDSKNFQYNSGDLVYIISPLTSQLRTASRKVTIKYVGPLVIYRIVDPHNYRLMTLDGKILRGLFKHKRLKPVTVRTSHGNVNSLVQLKQVLTLGMII